MPPPLRDRRRRWLRWLRLLSTPLSARALEERARRRARPIARWLWGLVPVLLLALVVWGLVAMWTRHPPALVARHRPEALCFALAQPPAFAPPMAIEPSAAVIRGRFGPTTPPEEALRQTMHFNDEMVASSRTRHVGDYDVAAMWLRLPDEDGARFWLVLGWIEGSDLAVCNFRFADDGPVLTPDQEAWGDELMARILVPANFRAGGIPEVRLNAARGATMPSFGPRHPG